MATKITSRVIAPGAVTSNSLAEGISLGGGGPKISNVAIANSSYGLKDDTAIALEGGYLVITGTGFETGCQVIVGSNNAVSTTFVNSTTLQAQIGAADAGSKAVYVVNTDGGTAIRVNGVTYSAVPSWVTSSSLPGQAVNNPISIQLSASDAITYQLQAGSTLPTGLTLSANGLLSGTVTGVVNNTNYSFIIEAIDSENQESPRTFNLAVEASDFDISPAVNDLESWKFDTNGDFVLSSNGEWTMTTTSTKTFNIKMWGAGGGKSVVAFFNPSINYGGGGGYISGDVTIPAGTYKLRIGGGGLATGAGGYNGGGTGGTWVGGTMAAGGGGSTGIYLTNVAHDSVVMIAAGGGGGAGNDNGPIGRGGAGGGNTGQNGTSGSGDTSGKGGTQIAGGAAGTGGNLGQAGDALQGGFGGIRGPSGSAGGGGGGGYYGGGGGSGTTNTEGAGGGGGGSSFANTIFVANITSTTGNYEIPGNNSDSDRGTAGNGATTVGENGTAGKIVIRLVT